MKRLTKEDLLRHRPKSEPFEIPELGGCVYLTEMNVGERAKFWETVTDNQAGAEDKAKLDAALLFVLAVHDEKGEPLFTVDDVEEVRKLYGATIHRAASQWMKINGLASDSVEQAEKN